jgi:hypothetical protein
MKFLHLILCSALGGMVGSCGGGEAEKRETAAATVNLALECWSRRDHDTVPTAIFRLDDRGQAQKVGFVDGLWGPSLALPAGGNQTFVFLFEECFPVVAAVDCGKWKNSLSKYEQAGFEEEIFSIAAIPRASMRFYFPYWDPSDRGKHIQVQSDFDYHPGTDIPDVEDATDMDWTVPSAAALIEQIPETNLTEADVLRMAPLIHSFMQEQIALPKNDDEFQLEMNLIRFPRVKEVDGRFVEWPGLPAIHRWNWSTNFPFHYDFGHEWGRHGEQLQRFQNNWGAEVFLPVAASPTFDLIEREPSSIAGEWNQVTAFQPEERWVGLQLVNNHFHHAKNLLVDHQVHDVSESSFRFEGLIPGKYLVTEVAKDRKNVQVFFGMSEVRYGDHQASVEWMSNRTPAIPIQNSLVAEQEPTVSEVLSHELLLALPTQTATLTRKANQKGEVELRVDFPYTPGTQITLHGLPVGDWSLDFPTHSFTYSDGEVYLNAVPEPLRFHVPKTQSLDWRFKLVPIGIEHRHP